MTEGLGRTPRGLSFGSLNRDIVHGVPHIVREGETIHSTSRTVGVGGKGLNQAVALARAGLQTAMAGCVGSDGGELVAALAECGVATDGLCKVDEASGYALVQLDPSGSNCIIVHGGANQLLTPDYVAEALDALSPGDLVAVQNETNLVAEIIAEAHRRGLVVAWNPSPVDERVAEVDLGQLAHLLVNEGEAMALTGEDTADAALDALARRHPSLDVVMTRGSRGVTRARGDERVSVPALDVPVVDTTGAGDTFTGYYLASVMQGLAAEAALVRATRAAGLAVGRSGAAGAIPDHGEVDSAQ